MILNKGFSLIFDQNRKNKKKKLELYFEKHNFSANTNNLLIGC